MTDALLDLAHGSVPALVAIAYLVALGEAVPGLGFLLPGEMTIVALSSLVATPAQLAALWLAVAAGAVTGDHLGYGLGRRWGERVQDWSVLRRTDRRHWERAESFVRRRGAPALVVSRTVPVVRTILPVVAGASGLRYRTFVLASVAGCLAWSALWVTGGAALRAALGPAALPALVVAGLVGAVATLALLVRRRARSVPDARCETATSTSGDRQPTVKNRS